MDLLKQPVRRHSLLRRTFFASCRVLASRLGGRRWYRKRYLDQGRLVVRHEILPVPDLPKALHGLRILHLSDVHAGPFLGRGDLLSIQKILGDSRPDVLVLTGDYITHDWRDVLTVVDDLGPLVPKLGGFAVFGNHDYRGHQEGRIVALFRQLGITCLHNRSVRVGDLPLWITGLSDLEEMAPRNLGAIRPDLALGELEIVLCHHPLGAPALARDGCIAVLAGHTHGRQIDWPWLRNLGPSHPGLRIRLGPTTLYVNRGLGVVGVPLRVGAPAEVVWIELVPACEAQSRPHSTQGSMLGGG